MRELAKAEGRTEIMELENARKEPHTNEEGVAGDRWLGSELSRMGKVNGRRRNVVGVDFPTNSSSS